MYGKKIDLVYINEEPVFNYTDLIKKQNGELVSGLNFDMNKIQFTTGLEVEGRLLTKEECKSYEFFCLMTNMRYD